MHSNSSSETTRPQVATYQKSSKLYFKWLLGMLSLYSSTHVQTLARVSLMLIAYQALFCQEKWSQGFDHQEKAFRRAIACVLPPSVRRKKCRGGTSLRKGKHFLNKYSWPKIKCLSLNINCNTRSSLKRNLQRTLTRRGSSEKEMSRNRLEKVDMIKLKRNILFINLPSGSKLIFDHSQLCTRRAQGEWDCILGLFETTHVEPPHVKSFASFPQVYMAWVPLLFGRPPSYWFSADKVKPMLQNRSFPGILSSLFLDYWLSVHGVL